MGRYYNKYRYTDKGTRGEAHHSGVSLKKQGWKCKRNKNGPHQFREVIPYFDIHWKYRGNENQKKYGYPLLSDLNDRFDPEIIRLWHEAEKRKDDAEGSSWLKGFREKNGSWRQFECIKCGKQASDLDKFPKHQIRNNLV